MFAKLDPVFSLDLSYIFYIIPIEEFLTRKAVKKFGIHNMIAIELLRIYEHPVSYGKFTKLK